jgi:hypothetical protein
MSMVYQITLKILMSAKTYGSGGQIIQATLIGPADMQQYSSIPSESSDGYGISPADIHEYHLAVVLHPLC